jgi:hypothetical protein
MTIAEKKEVIVNFYKTIELLQKEIESSLDEWLNNDSTEKFTALLLTTAELAIKLLQLGRHRC